jgi:hypothetical protein
MQTPTRMWSSSWAREWPSKKYFNTHSSPSLAGAFLLTDQLLWCITREELSLAPLPASGPGSAGDERGVSLQSYYAR